MFTMVETPEIPDTSSSAELVSRTSRWQFSKKINARPDKAVEIDQRRDAPQR
jgi:hypothetical protein